MWYPGRTSIIFTQPPLKSPGHTENENRRLRLDGLLTSIGIRNTDLSNSAKTADANKQYITDVLNELMASKKMPTLTELRAQAEAKMTPEQKEQWTDYIKKGREFSQWTDILIQIGLDAMLPQMAISAVSDLITFVKWAYGWAIGERAVQVVRTFETAGQAAGAAATEEFVNLIRRNGVPTEGTTAARTGDVAAAEAAEGAAAVAAAAPELAQASRWARFVKGAGLGFKILNIAGFGLASIVSVIEIVEGAAQKTKLIEGIHTAQVARLGVSYISREVDLMIQQSETIRSYAKSRKDAPPNVSEYLGNEVISRIKEVTGANALKYETLQGELEKEDTDKGAYRDDDLSSATVVQKAKEGKPSTS